MPIGNPISHTAIVREFSDDTLARELSGDTLSREISYDYLDMEILDATFPREICNFILVSDTSQGDL